MNPVAGLTIDHVAIAVHSIEESLGFWRDQLGAEVIGFEDVPTQKVRVAFLRTGEAKTELLEPTADDSPIARSLAKRGPGIHHIAYRVADIDRALDDLRAAGVRVIGDAPVPGSRGMRVAFLHPGTAGGVLIELVEKTGGPE